MDLRRLIACALVFLITSNANIGALSAIQQNPVQNPFTTLSPLTVTNQALLPAEVSFEPLPGGRKAKFSEVQMRWQLFNIQKSIGIGLFIGRLMALFSRPSTKRYAGSPPAARALGFQVTNSQTLIVLASPHDASYIQNGELHIAPGNMQTHLFPSDIEKKFLRCLTLMLQSKIGALVKLCCSAENHLHIMKFL